MTPGQRIQHIQHVSRKTRFRKNVVLSGEMLNMLNSGPHVESKCASFCRNVENVEYVEGFGEN